ncbi:MAG: cupin domain-containing protein [Phycisphaerales bacterium]
MLIRRATDMDGAEMRMDGADRVQMRLLLGREDGAPTFAMRHFTVESGGHSPRHEHNYEHGIFIVAGRGSVEVAGETQEVAAGDSAFIPPNTVHQLRADQGEELQFLCMVPTTFDCGKPTPGS